LLPTEQIQQNKHPLAWPQNREQTNLLAQRAAEHPHSRTGREAARPRQLDQPVALSRPDLGDDGIGNVRRMLAVHDQTPHARSHRASHQAETTSTKA
jgi:hypothetical protein